MLAEFSWPKSVRFDSAAGSWRTDVDLHPAASRTSQVIRCSTLGDNHLIEPPAGEVRQRRLDSYSPRLATGGQKWSAQHVAGPDSATPVRHRGFAVAKVEVRHRMTSHG